MKHQRPDYLRSMMGLVLLAGIALIASATPDTGSEARSSADAPAAADASLIAVEAPPFSPDIFPCSECHAVDDEVNRTPRELTDFHEDIVLQHGEESRWCLDCHNPQTRDKLHLASGEQLAFEESYRLCGQCHGPKLRDWRAGDHGKRTGYWDGPKQYLLCVHCHNPHSPHFKPIKPMPPPLRPEEIRLSDE